MQDNEDKKILVCGDVSPDHVSTLFNRVTTLCKSQSFDMLLIAGQFVSKQCSADFSSEVHLQPFLSGAQTVPVMTYFVHELLEPSMVCENLVCVGAAGLLELAGLHVGFLSAASLAADVVLQQHRQQHQKNVGLDVLLSAVWPRNVLAQLPSAELPPPSTLLRARDGSDAAARACVALAPRYVFVPSPDQFVERRPFVLEGHRHVCRFLALAPVGNAEKQKWLFAFKLRSGEVLAVEGASPSPFQQPEEQKQKQQVERRRPRPEEADEGGFQRWGALPPQDDDHGGGRRRRENKGPRLVRNAERGAACWFCLESETCETHLVASVGAESYAAIAKGALVPGHVLLAPLLHVSSFPHLAPPTWKELSSYMAALRKAAASRGEAVLFYERNVAHAYSNPHAHVQAIPVPLDCVEHVGRALLEWKQWELESGGELPEQRMRSQLASTPYFWIRLQDKLWVNTDPKVELDFGRKLVVEAMGLPQNRIHWKRCVVSQEEESKQVEEFTKSFRPFDTVLTGK